MQTPSGRRFRLCDAASLALTVAIGLVDSAPQNGDGWSLQGALVLPADSSHNETMESQLASARVLLMAAVVPIAVFLSLRAAGVEAGLALRGGSSMPSSDVQVVAEFTAPTTSADDLFDRRAGTHASVAFGGFAVDDEGSTKAS